MRMVYVFLFHSMSSKPPEALDELGNSVMRQWVTSSIIAAKADRRLGGLFDEFLHSLVRRATDVCVVEDAIEEETQIREEATERIEESVIGLDRGSISKFNTSSNKLSGLNCFSWCCNCFLGFTSSQSTKEKGTGHSLFHSKTQFVLVEGLLLHAFVFSSIVCSEQHVLPQTRLFLAPFCLIIFCNLRLVDKVGR